MAPSRKPPTQKQIAERLGVSQALVSRALSGRATEIGASAATVEQIRLMAAEMNYQPNATALALLGAPTRTIGVVVKNFDDPYFGQLIGTLQALARENRYSLLLTGGDERDISALRKHSVDGVILVGGDFRPSGMDRFAEAGTPMVQIGAETRPAHSIQVCMNEEAGIGELTAYLARLGHRDFGFAGGGTESHRRRGKYFQNALRARNLPVRDEWLLFHEGNVDEIADASAGVLQSLAQRPTALLVAEDFLAVALLRKLAEAGIRVPRDISLVGIDDIQAAAQTIPPLTTLQQPMAKMVAAAFGALIRPAKAKALPPIKGKVVLRRSCAPPHSLQPTV